MLGGGFIEGASYIVQGQPGAGKTIFSNQIAFANLSLGSKVLYVTLLAETHERLFQVLGTLQFFDAAELGRNISYVSVFQILRDQGLSAVVSLIREEINRQSATLLVFDGLLNARDRGDSDLDIKAFVAEVQSQAAFAGCTVLFLTSNRVADDSPEHTMVDGVIELTDEMAGVRTVRRLQVKKSRGSAALGGFHQFEISSSGITVYPRLEIALKRPSEQEGLIYGSVPSGIEGLDSRLGGGIPTGSVSLVFGPSGSGKTSFGLSFLSASTQAEPGLLFNFYETPSRLQAKARSIGLDLEPLVQSEVLDFIWNPMGENLVDKLAHRLLHEVRSRGTKRLLIDGLGGFERAAVYQPRLVEFFATLSNELRSLGVTTVATWELRDLFGPTVTTPSSEISSLMDNLIMLRQVEIDSRYARAMSILKVRDSAFDPVIHELTIGNNGLGLSLPLKPVASASTGLAQRVD